MRRGLSFPVCLFTVSCWLAGMAAAVPVRSGNKNGGAVVSRESVIYK